MVNFGSTVIGETINRKITLQNKGALGTKFILVNKKAIPVINHGIDSTVTKSAVTASEQILKENYQSSVNDLASIKPDIQSASTYSLRTVHHDLVKDDVKNGEISIGSVNDKIL